MNIKQACYMVPYRSNRVCFFPTPHQFVPLAQIDQSSQLVAFCLTKVDFVTLALKRRRYNAPINLHQGVTMHKVGIVAAVALITGCATSTPDKNVGMPNPASAYCVELGGTVTIVDRPEGQIGFCTLPDGTQLEEWDLYRRDHG